MTSLRGSSVNIVVADELPTTVVRLLQTVLNVTASQQQNSNVGSSNPYENNAFMMFLTVIVVLVVLCYIVCLWHMVRIWCCKRSATDQQAAHDLVISGRVFDLTPDQRRAVLEAIFSETSKAVTESDVACRKEKRKRRNKSSDKLHGDIPSNVEIPTLKSVNTLVTSDGGSDHDVEEGVLLTHEPDIPALPSPYNESNSKLMNTASTGAQDWSVVQNVDGQFIIQSDRLPSSDNLPSPLMADEGASSDDVNDNSSVPKPLVPTETTDETALGSCRPLPFKMRQEEDREVPSPIFRRFPVDLTVPDLREDGAIPLPPPSSEDVSSEGGVEESKEEEKSDDEIKLNYSSRALLSEPITFTRVESIGSAYTSEFDDETEDYVCPICLNSYHEGDILIASKHCSHLFHKDCILEWLEKHDSCPVCRVDMITEGEMNQAATSIVGRTRMYVAVESITRSPRHVTNAGTHRHVLPAHRHIIAAPRTPPPSPPHRIARLGYASR